jgi:D-3-phosphoglycerate dehydrogenase
MTLGIVGLGRIGKRMAQISRDIFARVVAYDPYLIDGDFPVFVERLPTLDALARAADVVSVHTPLTKETRGMIDAGFFAAMPAGGYVVNTARGAVVDVAALVAALDGGHLAAAGLDVLPVEPVPRDSPLVGHPRVVLTPHSAFYSVEAEQELRRKAAQNLATWLATGRPEYVVSAGTREPPR